MSIDSVLQHSDTRRGFLGLGARLLGGLAAASVTSPANATRSVDLATQLQCPEDGAEWQVISYDLIVPNQAKRWNSFHLFSYEGEVYFDALKEFMGGDKAETVKIQNPKYYGSAAVNGRNFKDIVKLLHSKNSPLWVFREGLESFNEDMSRAEIWQRMKKDGKFRSHIETLAEGGHMRDLYRSGTYPGHEMSWSVFANNIIVGQFAVGQRERGKIADVMGIQYERFKGPNLKAVNEICEYGGEYVRVRATINTPSRKRSGSEKSYSVDMRMPMEEIEAALGVKVDKSFLENDLKSNRLYRLQLAAYVETVIASRSDAELKVIYRIDGVGRDGNLPGDTLLQRMRQEKWGEVARLLPHEIGGYSNNVTYAIEQGPRLQKPVCCCPKTS